MEVFRIVRSGFAGELKSSGTANRWNQKGQNVIYAGASRSLSTLELTVHRGSVAPLEDYSLIVISIADDDYLYKHIQIKELPVNWRKFEAYSVLQSVGAAWYRNQESLVLVVPSAVIPFEHNYIINTDHPDFHDKVKLVRTEPYFWDTRLL